MAGREQSSLRGGVQQCSVSLDIQQHGGTEAIAQLRQELGQTLWLVEAQPLQPPAACTIGGHTTAQPPRVRLNPMKPIFRPGANLWVATLCHKATNPSVAVACERQPSAPGHACRQGLGAASGTPRPWGTHDAPRPSKAPAASATGRPGARQPPGGGEVSPAGAGRGLRVPRGREGPRCSALAWPAAAPAQSRVGPAGGRNGRRGAQDSGRRRGRVRR